MHQGAQVATMVLCNVAFYNLPTTQTNTLVVINNYHNPWSLKDIPETYRYNLHSFPPLTLHKAALITLLYHPPAHSTKDM